MPFIDLHLPSFTWAGAEGADLFPRLCAIAETAERSGFTSISVMDHFHQIPIQGSDDEPMLESYTTLGALAARTSQVQLLTLVSGVIYHNPVHLAKQVTTLDVLSRGRAMLGIGAAWFEQEARAYGFDFPPVGERLDRLDEALRICRSMFDNEVTEFDGAHYHARGARNIPRPVRSRVPILIGGSGERRTLRLVARHGDYCNLFGGPERLRELGAILDRHCETEGRDPAGITRTAHLRTVLVGADEAAVQRRVDAVVASPPPNLRGADASRVREGMLCATPDQLTEQTRAVLDAGMHGVTLSLHGVAELEPIELAGAAVRAAFD